MTKLLSCRYNMDTNRVEARFEDGITLAIDCIAVEDEYGNSPAQQAGRLIVAFFKATKRFLSALSFLFMLLLPFHRPSFCNESLFCEIDVCWLFFFFFFFFFTR